MLTYDFEPRTIVMSCVYIMLDYFRKDNCASFGFVAADDLVKSNHVAQSNKRFRFYRRMMLSIFGSETFVQGYDINNSVYILINKSLLEEGIVSVSQIEEEISRIYEGAYSLVLER